LARRVCRAVRHARYHVSITSLTGSLRPRGLDSRLGKVLRSHSLSPSKEFIVTVITQLVAVLDCCNGLPEVVGICDCSTT